MFSMQEKSTKTVHYCDKILYAREKAEELRNNPLVIVTPDEKRDNCCNELSDDGLLSNSKNKCNVPSLVCTGLRNCAYYRPKLRTSPLFSAECVQGVIILIKTLWGTSEQYCDHVIQTSCIWHMPFRYLMSFPFSRYFIIPYCSYPLIYPSTMM
jgi:hypothetical protein